MLDAASQTFRTLAHGFNRGNAMRDAASQTFRTLAHGFNRGNAMRDAPSQTFRTLAHGISRGYAWEHNARRGIPNVPHISPRHQPWVRVGTQCATRHPKRSILAPGLGPGNTMRDAASRMIDVRPHGRARSLTGENIGSPLPHTSNPKPHTSHPKPHTLVRSTATAST